MVSAPDDFSHTSCRFFHIIQRNLDQQVTTKAKTTRRRGGSTTQQTQLTRLRHPSDSPLITGKFDALLQEFGPLSDVYKALQQSQFADAHRDRLLNAFGASTVFRYLQSVQQFSHTLKKLGVSLTELTVTQLVDCLAVMSHARASSSDAISGNFTLKALRWFRKIAGVSCLDIVFSPLADSFLKVRLTTDKKEAPPLPLWILFHWEKRILFSQSSTYEVIMLGAFLFMTWSSLRFSDVQRLNIESLVLTDVELRGMVWRSKTRSNGHPFGITCSGLCSTGSFTWLVKFLRTWDALLAESGCSTWDFLIPRFHNCQNKAHYFLMNHWIMRQLYEFFGKCFIHLGNVFHGPIHWKRCILTIHFTVRKQRCCHLDPSWGRQWTQMIVCNRVTTLTHESHFICMDEIQYGGPYDISKLWCNRSGRDSAQKRHNTEGDRHPWLNLKLRWSVSRNRQLSMHIGIFLFLHQS